MVSSVRNQPRPRNDVQPDLSNVLGVFGLSMYTKEEDLEELFVKYGPIDDCTLILDATTNRSRGFGFITYDSIENATAAMDALNDTELDNRKIRVHKMTRS
ncbi:the Rna recognition motif in ArginineSERINE-rich splicing factor 10 [Globomyces pollinis-pini]|nr:the Rna recognition motif in ArginineSERINE-rich splicing factor 10 [Globomyces pollinis-pini]